MSPRRLLLIGAVAVAAFALDQITKTWIERSIPLNDGVRVVDDYLRIVHTRNSGAAFGLLADRTTLLALLSVGAVIAIVLYYRQIAGRSALVAATLGLQLGGAFGNLVNRVGQKYVVDFIDVGVPDGPRFWAFNLADSSIVLGIVFVTLLLWNEERKAQPTPA